MIDYKEVGVVFVAGTIATWLVLLLFPTSISLPFALLPNAIVGGLLFAIYTVIKDWFN